MKKNFIRAVAAAYIILCTSLCFAKEKEDPPTLFSADRNGTTAVLAFAAAGERSNGGYYCEILDISFGDETAEFYFCWSTGGDSYSKAKYTFSVTETDAGKTFAVKTNNKLYYKYGSGWKENDSTIILKSAIIAKNKKALVIFFTNILTASDEQYKNVIENIKNTESLQKYIN